MRLLKFLYSSPVAAGINTGVSDKTPVQAPTFAEAFRFWLKLGFISFGGPAGQIAIMHAELVEKRRWISEAHFLHALNYCMLLPGPEATQLATYVGWLLHKTRGGIVAGTLFVLPSSIILWALSYVYIRFGSMAEVGFVFQGLKPAVVAIVAAAVIRMGTRALKTKTAMAITVLAFVAIYFFRVPFPVIVFTAAAIGLFITRFWPGKFLSTDKERDAISASPSLITDTEILAHTKPPWPRRLRILGICLILWWAPVIVIGGWLGWNHALFQEGIFFSKASMVTFGGAYAVLPYVSQQAVTHYHWLSPGQMLDGLGLAETTPGPLIIVLQFVGFLGGWQHPGNLTPLVAGTLGAFITTWTTFVPCFLWIFLGAPHLESIRGNRKLTAALSAVTAAVVGVVLNLAIWFGGQVLFPPSPPGRRIDAFALAVAVIAFIGIWRWKWNVIAVVFGAGALGWIIKIIL